MLAAELLLLLCLGAALAPDSVVGHWLIRMPAAALAKLTPRQAAVSVLSAIMVLAFLLVAPELVGVFGLLDFSLLMDVAALSLLMSAGARLTAVHAAVVRLPRLKLRVARPLRRLRSRRPRTRYAQPDDPDGPAWAFA